ncbi:MAG: B12-binding domain-containing radical SAM protein [Candidatus Omnitrophica bacterium]|nr:B12-binding domain-containing radical SAM protein [Candidatus Omnitrophota bacterium]
MRVVLVYPGITMEGFAKPATRPKTGYVQHGLCHISAALKNKGHKVFLIDLRQLFDWQELPGIVRRIKPDVAGITVMSMDFDVAVESARIIKETGKDIKVIVGGIHPTIVESDFLDNPWVDYVFKGEAEMTLPEILDDLAKGNVKDKTVTGRMPDLDSIPFVDRELFGVLEAPWVPFLKMPFITTVAGRGCVYNCNFCQPAERKLFGAKIRRISPERLIEELRFTKNKTGLNSLMIHDDCLVEDEKWVERFLGLYGNKDLRKPFICQGRADIIVRNPALFRDMKRYGLALLLIGFESGSQRLLNFLRKGTTVEQNYKAAGICKRLGIRIFANFMLGIPTETREEALATVRMIKKIKPYVPSPAFYTPFPGSDLFEYCKKNNLSLITKHSDYKRDPVSPKIKGIDYDFLNKILSEVKKLPPSVRLKRKIDRLTLGRFNKELIRKYNPPCI